MPTHQQRWDGNPGERGISIADMHIHDNFHSNKYKNKNDNKNNNSNNDNNVHLWKNEIVACSIFP